MPLRIIPLLYILVFGFQPSDAQEKTCGFDHVHQSWLRQNEHRSSVEKFERSYQNAIAANFSKSSARYVLPIVVHIIHDNGAENISDQQVIQGIQHLNDAFANLDYYNPDTGVDVEVEFCLAKRDPSGGATTGINRVQSPLTEFNYSTEENDFKDLSRWDPRTYINIWVAREICSASGCGVIGYAYFPTSHGSDVDGIVVESPYIGSTPPNSAVLAHEMGHYLGLYHTFQGGCHNNDCLADGDRVCDTPPDQTTVRTVCDAVTNSCTSDEDDASANNPFRSTGLGGLGEQPDQFQNYMDYSRFECFDRFTEGQKDRMHFAIEQQRSSLLSSNACEDPCLSPITLQINASATDIEVGETVQFTQSSNNGETYNWLLDGTSFSTDETSQYTFNSEGNFTIVLEVSNSEPSCFLQRDTVNIRVTCPVIAGFEYERSGDLELTFTDTSQNALRVEYVIYNRWGDLIYSGTDRNFVVNFSAPGVYFYTLTVEGELCGDEINGFFTVLGENSEEEDPCSTEPKYLVFEEPGYEIVPLVVPAGSGLFYVAYVKGDAVVIHLVDQSLEVLKSDEFLVSPGQSSGNLFELFLDRENNLILQIRYERIGRSALVKYDPFNEEVLWNNIIPSDGVSIFSIHEYFNGEYLLCGQTNVCATALIMRVDKDNGDILGQRQYDIGNCISFFDSEIAGNNLLLTGRYEINAGNLGYRAALTSISLLDFTIEWSDHYFFDRNALARQGCTNIKLVDNELYGAGYSSIGNANPGSFRALVSKWDFQGNPTFSKEINLSGVSDQFFRNLFISDQNLYLFGRTFDEINRLFYVTITKLDLNGEVLASKRLTFGSNEEVVPSLFDECWFEDGILNVCGSIGSKGFFAKLSVEDFDNEDECFGFEELDYTERDLDLVRESNPIFELNSNLNISERTIYPVESTETNITEECGSNLPDFSMTAKEDSLCMRLQDNCAFVEIDIEYIQEDLNATAHILTRNPNGTFSSLKTIEVIRGNNPENEQVSEVICLEEGQFEPGQWYYILLNYDENNSTADWLDGFPGNFQECDYTNNIDSFYILPIPGAPDLGPDIEVCDNQVFNFNAGSGYNSYRWSDGTRDSTYTAYDEGLHWVVVTDACGNVFRDSIVIAYSPVTQVDLGEDVQLCTNEELRLSLSNNYEGIEWFPSDAVDCTDCTEVLIQSDSSITVTVLVENGQGCYSSDSVRIEIKEQIEENLSLRPCEGEEVEFGGSVLTESGNYIDTLTAEDACDTIVQLSLDFQPLYALQSTEWICRGDSFLLDDQWVDSSGLYTLNYETTAGCDSTLMIELEVRNRDSSEVQRSICHGDSLQFGEAWLKEAGTYQYVGEEIYCDSLYLLDLQLNDTSYTELEYRLCAGDSVEVAGEWVNNPGMYIYELSTSKSCDSTVVAIVEPVEFGAPPEVELDCEEPLVLAKLELTGDFTQQWSNGDTSRSTVYLDGDSAWVIVFQDVSCGKEYRFDLPSLPDFFELPRWEDTTALTGEPFWIDLGLDSLEWQVQWSPSAYVSCDSCLSTRLIYDENASIELELTHSSGCVYTYVFSVRREEQNHIYVPNSFSPNDDGANDFWEIYPADHVELILEAAIYNRWGGEMRRWENVTELRWNGRFLGEPMNPGVYVYYIRYLTTDGKERLLKGDLTLWR